MTVLVSASDIVLSVCGAGVGRGCVWSQQPMGTECLGVIQWNELLRFQEADVVFVGSMVQLGCGTHVGAAWARSLCRENTPASD